MWGLITAHLSASVYSGLGETFWTSDLLFSVGSLHSITQESSPGGGSPCTPLKVTILAAQHLWFWGCCQFCALHCFTAAIFWYRCDHAETAEVSWGGGVVKTGTWIMHYIQICSWAHLSDALGWCLDLHITSVLPRWGEDFRFQKAAVQDSNSIHPMSTQMREKDILAPENVAQSGLMFSEQRHWKYGMQMWEVNLLSRFLVFFDRARIRIAGPNERCSRLPLLAPCHQ